MKITFRMSLHFSLLVFAYGYDPLENAVKSTRSRGSVLNHVSNEDYLGEYSTSQVYMGPQGGLKDADKISSLPGQPAGTDFDQYSGYVTVDPDHGRALFYYLAESPINSSTNPLVLWLTGGCSSVGGGAMLELGPFRVNADNTTLSHNKYAWNNGKKLRIIYIFHKDNENRTCLKLWIITFAVANVLFLESPAGVGFSYSNTSSDYVTGDAQTARDSYTFLVNWLERFPEYKTRDFYITGESYAGHYVPQLAQLILQNNKITNQTVINLEGIAIGNPYVDNETGNTGMFDYFWTYAIISDEIHEGIISNCNFSEGAIITDACNDYQNQALAAKSNIYFFDIYTPLCSTFSTNTPSISGFDPCSENYVLGYMNNPIVQQSLHAKPVQWKACK
ncbi:putative carboxypeptidase D [Helianthus annuus]|nr:putative carboxypeptidase D [Helianthus annuus]KAJ0768109.1 putative carboxypeptidase D [Helianthus annuus]KAJ0773884.1 putative carboxypeptidase D [Helianthus annuus]KAJ0935627.1 putative carboxypeptidase D [Helianthus annuus]